MVTKASAKKPDKTIPPQKTTKQAKPIAETKTTPTATVSPPLVKPPALGSDIAKVQKKLRGMGHGTVGSEALKVMEDLRYRIACDSIKNLITGETLSLNRFIDRGTLNLDEVGNILQKWGFNLSKKTRKRLIGSIPFWVEKGRVAIPLKDIEYHDSDISFFLNGDKLTIPAKLLPFKSGPIVDTVRDILPGHLDAFIDRKFYLKAGTAPNLLKLEGEYVLRKVIKVDSTSLQIFEQIDRLKKRRGVDNAKMITTAVFGLCAPREVRNLQNLPPKFLKKPTTGLRRPMWDPQCAYILTRMADICYATTKDLWFKIGDILVWEEPKYSKATYIFEWPEEPLQTFIFRTWIAALTVIRNSSDYGYLDRANHTPNIRDWEKNLVDKMREAGLSLSVGKITI